jgi:fluoroacetyl-CoA thioesterase
MFACSNCMITQLVTFRGNRMELQIGLSSEKEMIVTENDLASVSGNIGAEVLSTHCLVLLMELAARQVVEGRIPEDKITLGTRVDIRHFSATLVGSRVRAVAHLIAIEHHRLYFHVTAYDDVEKLAEGENEPVIVSRNLFLKKIRRKTHSK